MWYCGISGTLFDYLLKFWINFWLSAKLVFTLLSSLNIKSDMESLTFSSGALRHWILLDFCIVELRAVIPALMASSISVNSIFISLYWMCPSIINFTRPSRFECRFRTEFNSEWKWQLRVVNSLAESEQPFSGSKSAWSFWIKIEHGRHAVRLIGGSIFPLTWIDDEKEHFGHNIAEQIRLGGGRHGVRWRHTKPSCYLGPPEGFVWEAAPNKRSRSH